jgi:hypothetical protein
MLYPTELRAPLERQALAVAKPETKDSDISSCKTAKRNPLVGGMYYTADAYILACVPRFYCDSPPARPRVVLADPLDANSEGTDSRQATSLV